MTIRAQQKLQTRKTIIKSAFEGLGADRSYGSLSLREVARVAGIAPTSFYRHFKDMDDLGVALVNESQLALKELMSKKVLVRESENLIKGSIDVFLSVLKTYPQEFRFLIGESSGNSKSIRDAIKKVMLNFTTEYAQFLDQEIERRGKSIDQPGLVAQIVITLSFQIGSEFLDTDESEHASLYQKFWNQMSYLASKNSSTHSATQKTKTITDSNFVL